VRLGTQDLLHDHFYYFDWERLGRILHYQDLQTRLNEIKSLTVFLVGDAIQWSSLTNERSGTEEECGFAVNNTNVR
jgi:hypothetical protein